MWTASIALLLALVLAEGVKGERAAVAFGVEPALE